MTQEATEAHTILHPKLKKKRDTAALEETTVGPRRDSERQASLKKKLRSLLFLNSREQNQKTKIKKLKKNKRKANKQKIKVF